MKLLLGWIVIFAVIASTLTFRNEDIYELNDVFDDDETYGAGRDIWEKVKAAGKKLGSKLKTDVIAILKEYKVKIVDALKGVGKVVIRAGKDWVIEVKGGVVKIIQDEFGESSDGSEATPSEYSIYVVFDHPYVPVTYSARDVWNKVKSAFKRFGDKVSEAAKRLGEKIAKGSKEAGKKIEEKTRVIREKIVKATQAVIEKYKDVIIESLKRDGEVIINEGRKIIIKMIDDVVHVIIEGIDSASGEILSDETYSGFSDMWKKVKVAAKKLGKKLKVDVVSILKEYKPKIVDALKSVGKVIIQAGKDWVIEVKDGVVKIIQDETASSSDDLFDDEYFSASSPIYFVYDSPETYSFKDVWRKVKHAAKKLGPTLKEATMKIIDKYRPEITKALKNLGKVVIDGVKKIVVTVKDDVVHVIVDGVDASSEDFNYISKEGIKQGFKDLWGKIKAATKHLGDSARESAQKVIDEFKPQILESLRDLKKIVVKGAKKVIIEVQKAIVKVIVGDESATSDGSSPSLYSEEYDIYPEIDENSAPMVQYSAASDIWNKVKRVTRRLGPLLKDKTIEILKRHKDEFVEALKRTGRVVIEAGRKVVIKVIDDVVHVFVDEEEV